MSGIFQQQRQPRPTLQDTFLPFQDIFKRVLMCQLIWGYFSLSLSVLTSKRYLWKSTLNLACNIFLLTQFYRKFHTRGGLIFVPERCLPQESISALKYCKKFVVESWNFSANFPNVCCRGQWKTFVPVAALSLKLTSQDIVVWYSSLDTRAV